MSDLFNDPGNLDLRREMRKQSTPAEKILWEYLRNRKLVGFRFMRQFGVLNYIVDFYCPKLRLAVELDGKHHHEERIVTIDEHRTEALKRLNITVIRFDNNEVLENLDSVICHTQETLELLHQKPLLISREGQG
ncbi:DUF559 domain-containing protein [Candidatus Uhrbacteria bacterium]|nr:DUF559 domain-containing protein [Candidatus Uhrbacteria bacterium]